MPTAAKVIFALLAGGASLFLGLVAFVALIYAFSHEMPRDQQMPTAIVGTFFAVIALALFALSIALIVSAVRAPR